MGTADEYCLICAAPVNLNQFFDNNHYKWLEKLIICTSLGNIYKANGEIYEGLGEFDVGKVVVSISPIDWHYSGTNKKGRLYEYGVVCHESCYKVLRDTLGYKLAFGNVCRILGEYYCLLKAQSKYGKEMKKYTGVQLFEFDEVVSNEPWLLENPLTNKRNRDRIVGIWKPLIAKFKKPRPSPCESASNFKVGKVLPGSNGEDWVVKKVNGIKKWQPVK